MKNYNDSIALVAAAIVVLAGSIAIGAGAIADSTAVIFGEKYFVTIGVGL